MKQLNKFLYLVFFKEGLFQKSWNWLNNFTTLAAVSSIIAGLFNGWLWSVAGLVFLLINVIVWSYRKWRAELGRTWVDKYEIEHGTLPVLPQFLLPFVNNYETGKPVHNGITITTPSLQAYARLKPSEKDKLIELWVWLTGGDPRDFEAEIDKTRPPGKGRVLETHFKR